MAAVLLVAAGLVAWWWLGRGGDPRPILVAEPGQNLLLITVDTLRADALGAYGGRAATPHLDGLATRGARYTSARAHAVMTLPSHASIMTGRHPFEHGVRDNAGFRLADDAGTLAAAARQKGMSTAAFVGAFPLDRQFGLAQGFDLYDDVGGREVAQGELALTERRAEDVVAAATAWIAGQERPWFAWVHVFDPHAPYAPPPPFDRDYASDPYAGEVAYVDHALGSLLDLAGRAARRTTVVVTSDHGEGLGEHGELTHGTFAYESTLRVPLIVSQVGGPARPGAGEGSVIDAPARHIDIFPTVAALLHLDVPAGLPGRSLLAPGPADPVATYFEAMSPMLTRGWAPLRGVIVDRHKYIELPIEEVYDLASDPREADNLAPKSERLPALAAALDRLDASLPGARGGESAEVRARLESLGYLSGAAARKARYTEDDDPKRLIELDRLMLEGLALFGGGRSTEAVQAYRAVIARRPDMNVAYRRLASIQWESGQPPEAIATLREALARNGPDIDVDIRLGTYLAETGAADEAIGILERVTAADPRHGEGLNALGIAYAQAGRPADALRAFARALEAHPRSAVSLENAATVHLQRGDAASARDAFVRALDLDPRSSRAHAGLGVVELRAGRQDAAITAWRRAVELDPSNFDALFNLATELVNAGRVSEARPFVEQFVRRAPPAFYGPDIARLRRVLEGSASTMALRARDHRAPARGAPTAGGPPRPYEVLAGWP